MNIFELVQQATVCGAIANQVSAIMRSGKEGRYQAAIDAAHLGYDNLILQQPESALHIIKIKRALISIIKKETNNNLSQ